MTETVRVVTRDLETVRVVSTVRTRDLCGSVNEGVLIRYRSVVRQRGGVGGVETKRNDTKQGSGSYRIVEGGG